MSFSAYAQLFKTACTYIMLCAYQRVENCIKQNVDILSMINSPTTRICEPVRYVQPYL